MNIPLHTLMKTILWSTLALILSAPLMAAEVLDRIVAVVNNEPIMQSELEEATFQALLQMRNQGIQPPSRQAVQQKVLEQLIANKVQLQRARQRGIQVTDEEINAQLAQIARLNGRTLEQLRQALEQQSPGSFEKLREQVHNQLMIQKLRQIEVLQNVVVTREEARTYLKQQSGGGEPAYRLRHILIRVPSSATPQQLEAARAKAEQLYAQLKQGADFAKLAIQNSAGENALKGGNLGWKKASELPDLFLQAIRSLKPGEISPILKSAAGFHILKLVDKRTENGTAAGGNRSEDAVMQALRVRKANELVNVWLQRLIDEAHIELYPTSGQ